MIFDRSIAAQPVLAVDYSLHRNFLTGKFSVVNETFTERVTLTVDMRRCLWPQFCLAVAGGADTAFGLMSHGKDKDWLYKKTWRLDKTPPSCRVWRESWQFGSCGLSSKDGKRHERPCRTPGRCMHGGRDWRRGMTVVLFTRDWMPLEDAEEEEMHHAGTKPILAAQQSSATQTTPEPRNIVHRRSCASLQHQEA